ncbi:nuclear transport factor 2 family protein [Streptomyces sp. NPDC088560]|uniref:nuclear transport factor 2 family protein n=1 Tax=Streptomyces sp. NPDC088560 TaxID=3365868 RepID=UPI0038104B4B
MPRYEVQHQLGRTFHACLAARDWEGIRALLTDDATWTLPGDNAVSGTADGAEAVVERAKKIASYGLDFELLHILVSPENMALSLHNTARRGEVRLDEYLSTVCRLRDGKIASIETYLSDVPGMDAFFVLGTPNSK